MIRFLSSPINPADVNMIQGVYGKQPILPAIGGNEGVGIVLDIGTDVLSIGIGDRVIPTNAGFGTWRTHAVANENELETVASDIPIEYAALTGINPCTAYRMLSDFASLQPGDVIVQNAANGTVGSCVTQIASSMGLKSINIVRNRSDFEDISNSIKKAGGTVVVSQEDVVEQKALVDICKSLPKPKLALNAVGGKVASMMARSLVNSGFIVTYGGMGRQPVMLSASMQIFNDLQARGFWMTRWIETHSRQERKVMLDHIAELVRSGKLVFNTESIPFSKCIEGVEMTFQSSRSKKILLSFD